MSNWKDTDKVKVVLFEEIKTGTANPWATSSTDGFQVLVESDSEKDVREYAEERMKSHPQAPLTREIQNIEFVAEGQWVIRYSQTIYHN